MNQPLNRVFAGMLMLASILLIWNQVATAAMEPLGESIEIATSDVPLSQLRTGTVTVRRCPECTPRLLRVNDRTLFDVIGTREDDSMDDPAARRAFFVARARAADGRRGVISLFVELDSDNVRSMRLSPRTGD